MPRKKKWSKLHEDIDFLMTSTTESPSDSSMLSTPTSSEPDSPSIEICIQKLKKSYPDVFCLDPKEKMLLISELTRQIAISNYDGDDEVKTPRSFDDDDKVKRTRRKSPPSFVSAAAKNGENDDNVKTPRAFYDCDEVKTLRAFDAEFNGFCTGSCDCVECPRRPMCIGKHYPTLNIPWAGRTYIIILANDTSRILDADSNVCLDWRGDDEMATKWYCHMTSDGWYSLRNVQSGYYLGHDNHDNIIATAKHPQSWEHMQIRLHPSGMFEIHFRVGGSLKALSESLKLQGQPARWRFEQVDF